MQIKFEVKQAGSLKPLKLSSDQYRTLGNAMIEANKKRIAKGVNIYDEKAKPLHPRYAKFKAKKRGVRRPIRDLNLTGLTLRSFAVKRAYGGIIRCEPSGAVARRRAYFSQFREPLIGFTSYEEKAVVAVVRRMFGRQAQLLWKPVSGLRY